MTTAPGGERPVPRWGKPVLGRPPTTGVVTVAWAGRCLLAAPRGPAAALARAVPAAHAGAGRACRRRGRRWWRGPARAQATSSPARLRLARTRLAAVQPVVVALATPRLGPWEGGVAGLGLAGRPLPSGGAVLPSPGRQGHGRATPLALRPPRPPAFPARGRWPLGAARGWPRAVRVAPWRQGGPDCSVRGRGRAWGTGGGASARGRRRGAGGAPGPRPASRRPAAGARPWCRRHASSRLRGPPASGRPAPRRPPRPSSLRTGARRRPPAREPSPRPTPGAWAPPRRRSRRRWARRRGGWHATSRPGMGLLMGRSTPRSSACRPRRWSHAGAAASAGPRRCRGPAASVCVGSPGASRGEPTGPSPTGSVGAGAANGWAPTLATMGAAGGPSQGRVWGS